MSPSSDYSEILSKEEIIQTIEGTIGYKIEDVQYEVRPASETPLGFLGEHVRIKATAKVNGRELNLQYFGKLIPTKIASHREYAEKTKAFYKEIELYKTLFDDIENALQYPGRAKCRWRPRCFFTRDWDLIILEDLSIGGYYILPERSLMELDFVKVTIKTMASMHAGSFIFEDKINKGCVESHSTQLGKKSTAILIEDLYPNLIFESECTDDPNHPGFTFWEVGIRSQLAIIDLLTQFSVEERMLIKKRFPDTIRQTYQMVKPSKNFHNVMIHGDLWGNNVLFKNGDDGNVAQAKLVDFQMTRYAPPAHDLLMFLHIVQDQTFRDTYEADLLKLYYNSLAVELAVEDVDINAVFPPSEFEESCNYYRRYAVLNQIIYTQLNITPADVCAKFLATAELYNRIIYEDRSEMLVESFKTDEFCRKRVTEAMENVIQLFHLNEE